MDKGQVKFIKPAKQKLGHLIKGYYIHRSEKPNFEAEVTFFQNITTTISIYHDSEISSEGRQRKQKFKRGEGYKSMLVGLVDKYQEVKFEGLLDRIAIVFYPCGLNHFVKEPLSNLLKLHFSIFEYYNEEFKTLLPKVFGSTSLIDKRDLLDQFFLNQYIGFSEVLILKAVQLLIKEDGFIKVEELAEQLGISRRTLLRKFKLHLGYTIQEYISVIKFRNALLNYQKDTENANMFEIAFNSKYYDQSDFNHQIKTRSGLTPKQLFNALDIIDDVLFWKK